MSRQRPEEPAAPGVRKVATVGDVVEIPLADLPGAGYSWTPVDVPAGLTLLDPQWSPTSSGPVGGARRRLVRVRADEPGDYQLTLVLGRPWEGSPAERRTVSIRVRPAEVEETR
ncbi:MAG: protease inhibitor I42 family protein [Jiangellaceae bacterium]|nr:protease inhibitor I42 family protein [Jiangellaceae bacterium]